MMILLCSKESKKGNKCTLHKGHKENHMCVEITYKIIEKWKDEI